MKIENPLQILSLLSLLIKYFETHPHPHPHSEQREKEKRKDS
jgi:hypothetical protein